MRGKDLLDKMELVDPAYVEEADIIPGKKKRPWIQWGIVAACMVGLMFAGGKLLLQNQSAVNENLPILSISENILGMGFEGYMAYDISELVNANPWNEEMEIATLPVYENTLSYDENAILTGADYDQIE